MSLAVNFRLVNMTTGEYKYLEDGSFRGSGFTFVRDLIDNMDKYNQYIPITDELFEHLCKYAFERLKEEGFCDLDANYGIVGFIKLLYLRDFYAKLGYTLCIEADW